MLFDSEKWDNEIANFGGIYLSDEDRARITAEENKRKVAEEWAAEQAPVTVVVGDYIIIATAIVFNRTIERGWSVSFRAKGNETETSEYAGCFGCEEEPTKERLIKEVSNYFAYAE